MQKIEIGGQVQEAVRLVYKNNDTLYVSIHSLHKISKYIGQEGVAPQLSKLGSEAWKQLKARTKKKIKDIAGELIKLYAKRRAAHGHAFPPDTYLQDELEASFFVYEDTPDQFKSTQEVKADMEKPYPMDRLICGDVGFGKTEVAIRAAFKAVVDGKQVAVLVPTTILALQHWKTFSERFKDFRHGRLHQPLPFRQRETRDHGKNSRRSDRYPDRYACAVEQRHEIQGFGSARGG